MNEVWKPIPGYEGFYEASDLGIYEVFTQKNVIAQNQPMASLLSAIFADTKPAFSARMENDAQK